MVLIIKLFKLLLGIKIEFRILYECIFGTPYTLNNEFSKVLK